MTKENLKLDGKVVCLDLSNSIPYKQKKNLIDLIAVNGGKVSFILTFQTDFIVKDDPTTLDTYKCRMGFKRNVPVVGINYIMDLIYNTSDSVNISSYSLFNSKIEEDLKKGIITSKFTLLFVAVNDNVFNFD